MHCILGQRGTVKSQETLWSDPNKGKEVSEREGEGERESFDINGRQYLFI